LDAVGAMETAMGADFSGIRFEQGAAPGMSAGVGGATDGQTVWLNDQSPEVLGEELAHVMQFQQFGAGKADVDGGLNDPAEVEARGAGRALAAGQAMPTLSQAPTARLHRNMGAQYENTPLDEEHIAGQALMANVQTFYSSLYDSDRFRLALELQAFEYPDRMPIHRLERIYPGNQLSVEGANEEAGEEAMSWLTDKVRRRFVTLRDEVIARCRQVMVWIYAMEKDYSASWSSLVGSYDGGKVLPFQECIWEKMRSTSSAAHVIRDDINRLEGMRDRAVAYVEEKLGVVAPGHLKKSIFYDVFGFVE
jgi:hypothetical protein